MNGTAKSDVIMVGVDGSEESLVALRWAAEHALRTKATLEVISVYEPVPASVWVAGMYPIPYESEESWKVDAERRLAEAVTEALGESGPEVAQLVIPGSPARELAKASGRADLLVLGSRHAHGFGRLLGSTGASCIRHAGCPVVIVPCDMKTDRSPAEVATI